MDLGWHEFLALSAASGAAAGLANQTFRFVYDAIAGRRSVEAQARELAHQETMQRRELDHQRDLQAEEREHQAAARRQTAFAEAAIHSLREISGMHPSKPVRDFASDLSNQIDNTMFYADFSGTGEPVAPDPDDFGRWNRMAHELIESMHDPDHQPVDPGPGRRPGT